LGGWWWWARGIVETAASISHSIQSTLNSLELLFLRFFRHGGGGGGGGGGVGRINVDTETSINLKVLLMGWE
jgi:hypothetical protein